MMKSYAKTILAKPWRWLLPVLSFFVILGFTRLDAPLYHQPIVQVTAVHTGKAQKQVDNFDNHDVTHHQQVQAKFLNTARRGQVITLSNTYSGSGALDTPLRRGDQVFVERQAGHYQLKDEKRDGAVLGLLAATICLMALVMKKRVWLTFGSILANVVLLLVTLHVETTSNQKLAYGLFSLMAVLFTVVTTVFIAGIKRQAAVIAVATLGATALALALGYGLFAATGYRDLHIEAVAYVTQVPQLLFFVQIMIGSLGAVLDESNDIAVAVMQLPAGFKQRFQAGMAIGRNVMGPLIAVLFMIFMADTFTESILWLRNDNAISQTFIWVMGLGFAQALISAFGIVLAVPLTSLLAAWPKKVQA